MNNCILFILCVKLVKQIFAVPFVWGNHGFHFFYVDSALSGQFIFAFPQPRV